MRVTARVPATSANLGPGFDCLGLALDLCNEVTVDTDVDPIVAWEGEGAAELPTDGTDMVSRAMRYAAELAGLDLPAFALRAVNRIPLERGLGSSAAACVAGLAIGDRLLGLGWSPRDLLRAAVELEGHPDNAAPAIHGGLTVALGGGVAVRLDPHPRLRPVALVPRDRLSTAAARAILPDLVPLGDAVFNLAHATATVVAMTARPDLLEDALHDRLHQPPRLALLPAVRDVFDRLRSDGVSVCLSGAGPSLLAFESDERSVPDLGPSWRALRIPPRATGAEVSDA